MWAHVKWTPSLVPYRPASEGLTSDRHADVRRGMKEVESKRQRLTFCPPNEAVKISSPCRFSVPHQHTRTGIEWGKGGGGGWRSRWRLKQSALCEGQPSVATDSRQPIATQRSPFTINFRLQPQPFAHPPSARPLLSSPCCQLSGVIGTIGTNNSPLVLVAACDSAGRIWKLTKLFSSLLFFSHVSFLFACLHKFDIFLCHARFSLQFIFFCR